MTKSQLLKRLKGVSNDTEIVFKWNGVQNSGTKMSITEIIKDTVVRYEFEKDIYEEYLSEFIPNPETCKIEKQKQIVILYSDRKPYEPFQEFIDSLIP